MALIRCVGGHVGRQLQHRRALALKICAVFFAQLRVKGIDAIREMVDDCTKEKEESKGSTTEKA